MPLNNYDIALQGNTLKERQFCALHGYLVQCYLDCRTAIHKDCPVLHWKYEGWSYGFITKDSDYSP